LIIHRYLRHDFLQSSDRLFLEGRSGVANKFNSSKKLTLENADVHVSFSLMELKVSYQHISLRHKQIQRIGSISRTIIAAIPNNICMTLRFTKHKCVVICPLMASQNDRPNGFMKVKSDLNCG
jgi:hypothetical protein